jgi:N-acetylmuramoyl-L-alanine amidase
MDGTLAGCDSWFQNPDSEVSAHYGISLAGEVHQYVGLDMAAWANGVLEAGHGWPGTPGVNPNWESVSIETEDNGDGACPVSDALYSATLAIGAAVVSAQPAIRYLTTHACISPQSRPQCPGDRWTTSGRFGALAQALGLTPYY